MQAPFTSVFATATAYLSEDDPVMRAIIERVGPCTLLPNPDAFHALVEAIISQQISVKAADAITARVRAALPEGRVTPEALFPLDLDRLRTLGLSMQKARYIRSLVELVSGGQLQFDVLAEMEDEEIIRQLTVVKGIGRWTAEMALIFTFGRADVLPVDDLGFLAGVRIAYPLPARPSKQGLRERGELWRPYRTFATWYIWRSRETAARAFPQT